MTVAQNLTYRLLPSLPVLSWCLRARAAQPEFELLHGSGVERVDSSGWFEGVWEGRFAEGPPFASQHLRLGSGGRVLGSNVQIVCPDHSLEAIYALRDGDRLTVSNSLAFVLAASGHELSKSYPYYQSDLSSFVAGLDRMSRRIPISRGVVNLYRYCDVLIDNKLNLRCERRHRGRVFSTFEEYEWFLRSRSQNLSENARDPLRTHPFEPIATVSSGYDSPACAVLAKEAGATKAVTFGEYRGQADADSSDSGFEIGNCLGLSTSVHDRLAYQNRSNFPEAEFLAVGTGGEDVVMVTLEDEVRGSLLFTGFLGDTLWGTVPQHPSISKQLSFAYPAGASLLEFRLRCGFAHYPLPQVDLESRESLVAISNSNAMEPWSVKGDYNRPIPRRIAESAGVPRELFGKSKRAITAPLAVNADPAVVLSDASLRDFERFCEENRSKTPVWRNASHAVGRAMYETNLRIGWRVEAFLGRRNRLPPRLQRVHQRFATPLSQTSLIVQWACEKLVRRYRDVLGVTS